MAKKSLAIDGIIAPWDFSKQLIRNFLAQAGKDSVEILLSSPGGSVDHAIDIYNQFRNHGDVTVIMSALNASSATLLGLGAKKTIIYSNSFYLIHKPMMTVMPDWSQMNADDIDIMIAKLEKNKMTLEKFTLEMAKMYMVKTGRTLKEVLDLMKENKWLNARDAKDFGFVDEILEPEIITNWLDDDRIVAMISDNDLPPIPGYTPPVPVTPPVSAAPKERVTDDQVDSIWTRILDRIHALINPQIHKKADMKIFALLNKVLGVTSLESADDKGVYLNETQMQAIEDQLATVDRSNLDKQQAETSLNDAITALDVIDNTVASAKTIAEKVTAIKTVLASKPGKGAADPKGTTDPVLDSTDWDLINSLPHNKEYDLMQ